jgi:hypothetical protein
MNSRQRNALAHALRRLLKDDVGLVSLGVAELREATDLRAPAPLSAAPTLKPNPSRIFSAFVSGMKWLWERMGSTFIPVMGSLLGVAASLLAFYPKFQISLQSPLDPANILTSVFVVEYDGPIPISNVDFHCVWVDVRGHANTNPWVFRQLDMHVNRPPIPMMYWGDTEAVTCNGFNLTSTDFAAIELWVDYSPYRIDSWRRSRIVNYITDKQSDGMRRFFPQVKGRRWGDPKDRAPLLLRNQPTRPPWPSDESPP